MFICAVVVAVAIGEALGVYEAFYDGPLTSVELADKTGCNARSAIPHLDTSLFE